MSPDFEPAASRGRYTGLGVVAALHIVIGYALVSGLARKAVEVIQKPLETVLIQEVTLPPPPPPKIIQPPAPRAPRAEAPPPPFVPPPEVTPPPSAAPAIESVTTPPPTPVAIAAPPPAPAAPAKTDIGIACPTQAKPEIPSKALQEGTSGMVRARATIRGGMVQEVAILSGPRLFHAAVRAAMQAYRCTAPDGTVAEQEFTFRIE